MAEEREESTLSEENADNSMPHQKALEDAQQKASENWDLFLRARAEGDNIRRRAQLDVENAHKYGIERFAKELLMVADSLDKGLEALSGADAAIREGYELTAKMFVGILEKFGVTPLNPQGKPFDPSQHEALTTQVDSSVAPNTVLNVIQKGYVLHDRLLRPARVIVSKAEEGA